jgi:uncharacterized membrane protein YhhN
MKKSLHTVFWILCASHLLGIVFAIPLLTNFTKPLLMPTLALWFWLSNPEQSGRIKMLFLLGLVYSTAGDVFLIFPDPSSFLLGLSSFLIAHLFYVVTFYHLPNFKQGLVFKKPLITAPVLLFLGLFLTIVFPNVPNTFRIPVLIYSLVIALMVISAINTFNRTTSGAAGTILAGAIFFLLSDSILACEKFEVFSLDQAVILRLPVMITYLTGQYFLARGMLKALAYSTSK